jgi:protein gp37
MVMGESTAISWCDHTFNLWIGCWKIDPECENCYAAATDNQRWGGEHWGRKAPRKWTGDAYWKQLAKWQRKAKADGVRRRVFVGSLMDWAETHPVAEIKAEMDARRARFFQLVNDCPDLDFLMLTKRIEDAAQYLPWYASMADWQSVGVQGCGLEQIAEPWPNIWIGTTAGTVKNVREHTPPLRRIAAAVRFVSGEPLIEEIPGDVWRDALAPTKGEAPIHWLIVGNESGPRRRAAELDWVRIARDEADRYGVAFHFKQWVDGDGRGKKIHLPILDGVQHAQFPSP